MQAIQLQGLAVTADHQPAPSAEVQCAGARWWSVAVH